MGHHDDVGDALDAATAQEVAETLQALSTPSRLLILSRLRSGPLGVGGLAEAVGMQQSAVSHQLRLLRHLGLVVGQREGRHVRYHLHDDHVSALLDQAVSHTAHVRLGLVDRAREREARHAGNTASAPIVETMTHR